VGIAACQNLDNDLVHACSLAGIADCLIDRHIPHVDHHDSEEPALLGWLVALDGVETVLEDFEMVARRSLA
jgi:hypothetical protein